MTARAAQFEHLRPQLLAVAYRLTGTFADAEDVVQDAWERWDRHGGNEIRDPAAWLTTVVSRLALDRLKSAARRHETYTGEWLPEPVVTPLGAADPLAAVVAGEDARFAAMVVLEHLTPDQRVAFVLHDGFGVPFGEIAEILGSSAAAARQLASRARRVASAAPPPAAAHAEIVQRLMAAMAAGDLDAIVAVLHPEVTFTGDANRRAPTAARVLRGRDAVLRFVLGLARRYGPAFMTSAEPVLVNGELGFALRGHPESAGFPALAPRIQVMTVTASDPASGLLAGASSATGVVTAIFDIANPDKFTASPLRVSAPTASGRTPRR